MGRLAGGRHDSLLLLIVMLLVLHLLGREMWRLLRIVMLVHRLLLLPLLPHFLWICLMMLLRGGNSHTVCWTTGMGEQRLILLRRCSLGSRM